MIWPKEEIPTLDLLYCYIHKSSIRDNRPIEKAFRNTPFDGGIDLSSDWNKYSSPEETRQRLAMQINMKGVPKIPADYYVLQFNVGDLINKLPSQKIQHDPIQNHPTLPDNRAHVMIIGEKDEEARLKMADIAVWVIKP